jgi:GTP-binding protein HflX
VGERLFHTLDPTTRAFLEDGRRYLLTDTVGFIRKLPHQLVEAFKATLEETVLADLILHVVDGSDSEVDRAESINAAGALLDEIGAGATPRLLVMNKIDLLDDPDRRELHLRHPDAVLVSAETGEGLDRLRARIADSIGEGLVPVELLIPFDRGDRLSELHEVAGDLEREDRADGVLVRALLPAEHADRFSDLSIDGRPAGRGVAARPVHR